MTSALSIHIMECDNFLFIDLSVICQEYRGKGIGTMMMRQMLELEDGRLKFFYS